MITTALCILALLVLSGFFSGSETALTAASKSYMHQLEREGSRRARLVTNLLMVRERLIATILLGNNLVNILASALATSLLIEMFGETGVIYATVIMTILVLIFAEILPKTYALLHTNSMALAVAPLMSPLTKVLRPLTALIQAVMNVMLRVLGAAQNGENSAAHTLAELRGAIELHTRDEELDETVRNERAMLRSVLDLADVQVEDIMIHRKNVTMIDGNHPMKDVAAKLADSPYSRLPVWQDSPDDIVGVLHGKALFRAFQDADGNWDKVKLEEVMSAPWFVPESTRLLDQLNAFRERREHFALVVDEYGSLQGVVTLEDILEEIVGDITDETDVAVAGVRPQPDGSIIVDGSVTIRDLNREFEWDLPDDEAATIAGLALHAFRTIPDPGQTFLFDNLRIEILRRNRNYIASLRIRPNTAAQNA